MTQCSHQELLYSEISNMLSPDCSICSHFMETTKQIGLICHHAHYKGSWEEQEGEHRLQEALVGCAAVLMYVTRVLQELQSPKSHSKRALNPTTSLLSLILCPLSHGDFSFPNLLPFWFSGVWRAPCSPHRHSAGAKATWVSCRDCWGQHKAVEISCGCVLGPSLGQCRLTLRGH